MRLATPPAEATGGPFVPSRAHRTALVRQLQRISVARAHVDRLNRTLVTVPVRQPSRANSIKAQASACGSIRSSAARRCTRGWIFAATRGDPVRATAAGTVRQPAEGGYGKLDRDRPGNGLSTRYGHLSEILVRVGQNIRVGQIVGRIGSTGRSTGPHLHYETRDDGDAVDPHKFLRAGAKLGLAQ